MNLTWNIGLGKKRNNADLLSRLPLKGIVEDNDDIFKEVFMIENVKDNPITVKEIARESENDQVLLQLKKWIRDGV